MSRLQDDLLYDFKEHKKFVYDQIDLFEPLEASLRTPAARRLISKSALIFFEVICYLLFAGAIAFAITMNKIFPFTTLNDMMYNSEFRNSVGAVNLVYFNVAVYVLVGIIALLFLIIGRTLAKIRLKNDILHLAAKDMKILVGGLLKRKASIETIEQRHFLDLPTLVPKPDVNTMPNPGFEEPK